MRNFTDSDWDRLVRQVTDGSVIPVLGAEMVLVPGPGGDPVPVEDFLGHSLSTRINLEFPPGGSLRRYCSEVLRRFGSHPDQCHFEALQILEGLSAAQNSPLSLLAEITDLNLFVSTTPDDFLRQALLSSRRVQPTELVFSPKRRIADLPDQDRPGTVLFKLFGTVSATADYVLSEEDFLVFVHQLQKPDYQPIRLLERLRSSTPLFLGSSFPDWLARFILYSAQGEPLIHGRSRAIVADRQTAKDEGLVAFLERSGAQVWPDGDGAAFVSELHRRWSERQRTRAAQTIAAPARDAEAPKDALFISYASEDLAAATRVAEALRAKGLPVWFDKQRLESGNDFWNRIRLGIENARYFLPLLSRNTQVERMRDFRLEWDYAMEVQKKWGTIDYLIPIVLDDSVSYQDPRIPPAFRHRHWEHAPDGRLSPDFLKSMLDRFRAYRSGRAGGRPNG